MMSIVFRLRQPGARADERPDARAAFDPAVALKVVQRASDRRPAQPSNAGELVIGEEPVADVGPVTQQVFNQLLSQRIGGAASGQRSGNFKNTLHRTNPKASAALPV